MTESINICIASTCNNYLKYVASFYESLCTHINKKYHYNLFLFSDKELDNDTKYKLFHNKLENLKVECIKVDEKKSFGEYNNLINRNKILLYRFILADYIKDNRCLFLDCDIIIDGDISELYFTNLGKNNIIGAAKDCLLWKSNLIEKYNVCKYFNAGVQLLDLNKWRESNLGDKALKFLNKNCNNLPFYDQDTLNILLKDKWLPISPKWNGINIATFTNKGTQYSTKEFKELKQSIIVHYAGDTNRPRGLICVHPKRYLYYKYIFKTKFWNISDIFIFFFRLLTSNYFSRFLYKIARLLFLKK